MRMRGRRREVSDPLREGLDRQRFLVGTHDRGGMGIEGHGDGSDGAF